MKSLLETVEWLSYSLTVALLILSVVLVPNGRVLGQTTEPTAPKVCAGDSTCNKIVNGKKLCGDLDARGNCVTTYDCKKDGDAKCVDCTCNDSVTAGLCNCQLPAS
jgi:hypothetical protein